MKRLVLVVFSFFLLGFADLAVADEVDKTSFHEVYKKYNELVAENNYSQAFEYAELAYKLGKENFSVNSEEFAALTYNLGVSYSRRHRLAEGRPYLLDALQTMDAIYGEDDIKLLDFYMELGKIDAWAYKEGTSKSFFSKAIFLAEKEFGESSTVVLNLELEIAGIYLSYSPRQSKRYYRKSYELGKKIFPKGDYRIGFASFSLGKFELAKKNKMLAEKYFFEALEIYEKTPPPDSKSIMVVHGFLIELYSAWHKDEKATEHSIAIGKILGDRKIEGTEALFFVMPVYPTISKEGYAVLEFTVDAFGKVKNIGAIESSHRAFVAASIEAIEQWRYAPRVVDGVPVDTEGVRYRFIFQLADR